MKKRIWLFIILVVIPVTSAVIYMTYDADKRLQVIKNKIAPPAIEESPYSIGWGSEIAQIVDQQGTPVANATITFFAYLKKDCNGKLKEDPPAWHNTKVTTNQAGEFNFLPEMWHLEEGQEKSYPRIDIEADGFLKRGRMSIGANYADPTGRIDILRAGRIEGVLIDPEGNALPNASLYLDTQLRYNFPKSSCGGCFGGNAKTDQDGTFVFENVPAGIQLLRFPGSSYSCNPQKNDFPFKEYPAIQALDVKDGQIINDVFFDLRVPRAAITGKVVDRQNQPMAGVEAVIRKVIKHYNASGWTSTTENIKSTLTDDNGNYTLEHIPIGDYQILAQYPYEKGKNYQSGKPLNIYITASQEIPFGLVLQRQDGSKPKPCYAQVSLFKLPLPRDLAPNQILIVDQNGAPIPNATVEFYKKITVEDYKGQNQKKIDWQGKNLTADDQGRFKLPEELMPTEDKKKRCYAKIKAPGFDERHVSLPPYEKNKPRVDLLPLSQIKGQIVGTEGKAVNAEIEIRYRMITYKNPRSALSGSGRGNVKTNEQGYFTLENVPQGAHLLSYTTMDPDTKMSRRGGVIVYASSGENIDDLVIDLREDTCIIQGHILDFNGKEVKGAFVRLSKPISMGTDMSFSSAPEVYSSEKTNRNGQYTLENIRPGIYQIEAVFQDKNRQRKSEMSTIAITKNQKAEINLNLKRH